MIFSTNLTPSKIMDAAMMRRIPYNFFIGPPTADEYIEIFRRVLRANEMPFDDDIIRSVMKRLYEGEGLTMSRFHPRFIVEHVLARCSYEGRDPRMDEERRSTLRTPLRKSISRTQGPCRSGPSVADIVGTLGALVASNRS